MIDPNTARDQQKIDPVQFIIDLFDLQMIDVGVDIQRHEETNVDHVKQVVADERDDDGVVVESNHLLEIESKQSLS